MNRSDFEALFQEPPVSPIERRLLWIIAALSIVGATLIIGAGIVLARFIV